MKTNKIIILGVFVLFLSACAKKEDLAAKKEELKEKKVELQKMESSIKELEKEISVLDPEFGKKNRKATLITTTSVETTNFEHYVEVSGAVKSRKNILISAENMGNIQRIPVKEGYEVSKGQLILSMDTELYQRTLEQLKTEYDLATTMFEKQSNLWDQNIGTEVQYLEAKNRKESLENQLANVRTQISKSQVRAPFPGTVEEVFVRVGEMAQPGTPLVRIVNHRDMYVKADLSESYIGNFKKGDMAVVFFPSLDKTIESRITSIGQVIDQQNRTFSIEVALPFTNFIVKPNLIATVKIKDFHQKDAVVVPSKLIQKDNLGDFVFVTEQDSASAIAKKVQINRGITYQNKTMILEGLSGNETLIDEGFRDVAEGTKVQIVDNVL
jgi:membrane fusion protein (multidrug efflux system)